MGSIFTLGFLVSRSCQADEESDKWVQNICVSNAFIVLCQDPVRFFTAQTFQPNILVTRHLDKTHLSASLHEARVNISLGSSELCAHRRCHYLLLVTRSTRCASCEPLTS